MLEKVNMKQIFAGNSDNGTCVVTFAQCDCPTPKELITEEDTAGELEVRYGWRYEQTLPKEE